MFRVLHSGTSRSSYHVYVGCIEGHQGEAGVEQQTKYSSAEPKISSPTSTKELDDLPPINEIESRIIDSSSLQALSSVLATATQVEPKRSLRIVSGFSWEMRRGGASPSSVCTVASSTEKGKKGKRAHKYDKGSGYSPPAYCCSVISDLAGVFCECMP